MFVQVAIVVHGADQNYVTININNSLIPREETFLNVFIFFDGASSQM